MEADLEDDASPGGDAVLPPHPRVRLAIGIDIGGTKIAAGVITAEGRIEERALVPTPMGDEPATVSAMRGVIEDLRERHPSVEAIGVGAAGLVDWPSGRIRWAPHNAYRQLPLRRLLYEATGLPTVVDNDANAAAWAEARYGAGAGSDHMVLLTVGTGIGGGLVLDGHVYRGSSGLGAEVGHMTVDPDGELVFQAAQRGDVTAIELFERLGFWLGVGIGSLVTVFDPELVAIGGGLVHTGDLLLKPARASMERYTFGLAHRELPPVVPARLGPDAGMVGAATLALRAGG